MPLVARSPCTASDIIPVIGLGTGQLAMIISVAAGAHRCNRRTMLRPQNPPEHHEDQVLRRCQPRHRLSQPRVDLLRRHRWRILAHGIHAGATVAWGDDPCRLPKACKTEAEIAATREAHLRDGAAMVEFLCWLEAEAPKGKLTEIDVVRALEGFRRAV